MDDCAYKPFFRPDLEPDAKAAQGSKSSSKYQPTAWTEWITKLTFKEQLCWAFKIVPSRLDNVVWSNSYEDLKFKLRVTIGDRSSGLAHIHQAVLLSGSILLGGNEEDKPEVKGQQIQSFAQLQQILNKNL